MIKLSGIQKTSLIDFPDNIATTVFTQGCNFRCPYCHNPQLLPRENENGQYIDSQSVIEFLVSRKHLLDGICITGGEPALQEGLISFIEKIKAHGFKVKLDTNGSFPLKLKYLLENNLLDYVAMDIKHTVTGYRELIPSNSAKFIEGIKESIKLLLKADEIDYEFRTTVVPGLHTDEDIREIANLIKGARLYYLQNFRPENTFNSELQSLNRCADSVLENYKKIAEELIERVYIRY